MSWIVKNLWLIPALPVLAAAISALAPQRAKKLSASLAIGSMAGSFLLSLCAFLRAMDQPAGAAREVFHFPWLQFASGQSGVLQLGWVLDPLTAVMLVMVTFVGTLIFIYSVGYMAHDQNFTRFFTFLALFAGAMLGVVIANSLLLLFICWELVGLTSYLLIGFWYHKPSAAAAAKKAFITTRIGDVAFLLGMVWLYSATGTLQFYTDNGTGCMEHTALGALVSQTTAIGMAVSTAIGLLIFFGAVGKSGQVPLHVWLPDAMEGPTPVSALIHAATMVAAGVFLVARVYPLMSVVPEGSTAVPASLQVVTWIGAITAVFAASIAVAQNDIKRILAYSTVSQLGYMMMGLGVGGVAVGMFHLITHAFFKALLFMGAGSVIHGCHDEQDIRRMGGLRQFMPVTFVTYAIGMMALAGVPLLFSGFWSKDEILHAAHGWQVSHIPFYLGIAGALMTAFYMTRQVALVFFGTNRGGSRHAVEPKGSHAKGLHASHAAPHESPAVMTMPLVILAVCAIVLGFLGTPAWPWFQTFLTGAHTGSGFTSDVVTLMVVSSVVVFIGIGLGWWFYGRKTLRTADQPDVLEKLRPDFHKVLENKYWIDELYEHSVIAFNAWWSRFCDFLDRWVFSGVVQLLSYGIVGLSWVSRVFDEYVVNLGFDEGCRRVGLGGRLLSRLQGGRVQTYLRVIGAALVVLVVWLLWGGRGS
ncbi:MAG TPA: NADH-quinone oxidoreductase subunit L [Verrucomicrobiae bacterium]|nr:NADH-quinone oxidoreductase subunit L [Verrucomicrobiae bacterium]